MRIFFDFKCGIKMEKLFLPKFLANTFKCGGFGAQFPLFFINYRRNVRIIVAINFVWNINEINSCELLLLIKAVNNAVQVMIHTLLINNIYDAK